MTAPVVEVRRIGADEWSAFREVRLAALAESPAAFGSTLEREIAFDDDVWQERVTSDVQPLPSDLCKDEVRMRHRLT